MNILILSQWYYPEPAVRIHTLAKALAGKGHKVTSITGIPNYPTGKIYEGYRFRPWPQVEEIDRVRVVRVPLFPEHSRSVLGRILNYISFALSASFFGPMLSGPIDVVWVYHPPLTVALPAMVISSIRRAPFVYEIQDLWPETLAATGMIKAKWVLNLIGALARATYRHAAALTVISPGFQRNLTGKNVPESAIQVIPNWADESTYYPRTPDQSLAKSHGFEGFYNVLYAGNMGAAQDLSNLIDAAILLKSQPRIRFVLVGDGIDSEALKRRTEAEHLDNIVFFDRKPPEEIARLASLSDVLLVHLSCDPLFALTIPAKTISSLACGRPILTVSSGDPADTIMAAGAGVACPPGNPQALATAVTAMCRASGEQHRKWGEAGRTYFLKNFSQAELIERYEELLTSVAACQ
jgi:glycosyltransferase involved in cell wall biosynthesis